MGVTVRFDEAELDVGEDACRTRSRSGVEERGCRGDNRRGVCKEDQSSAPTQLLTSQPIYLSILPSFHPPSATREQHFDERVR